MLCKPCRVTFEGIRYAVAKDGTVRPTRIIEEPMTDGYANPTGDTCKTRVYDAPVDAERATRIRHEAARQRRNRYVRERNQAMRDLNMTRTPFGWE